jgi:hypothetical protein
MAVGDHLIRRNASNTDQIPDSGSTLDLLWDTEVSERGSLITYSAGEFTLTEAGKYLITYSDQVGTTSTTSTEPLNPKCSLYHKASGGSFSETLYATSYGFIAKTSGSQECILNSCTVIDAAANDVIKIVATREDDTTSSGERPDRIADRSGIQIVRLDDSWKYGIYDKTSTQNISNSTNGVSNLTWDSIVEEDTASFELLTGVNGVEIEVKGARKMMVVGSFHVESFPTGANPDGNINSKFYSTDRITSNYWATNSNTDNCYVSNTNSCAFGSFTVSHITESPSNYDWRLVTITRNGIGSTVPRVNGGRIVFIDMTGNDMASYASVNNSNSTTDYNDSSDRHNYPTSHERIEDTGTFSLVNTGEIDLAARADVFVATCIHEGSGFGAGSAYVVGGFGVGVNGTTQGYSGASDFIKGTSERDHAGYNLLTFVPGLEVGDTLTADIDRLGTNSATLTGVGGFFSAVKVSTPPVSSDMACSVDIEIDHPPWYMKGTGNVSGLLDMAISNSAVLKGQANSSAILEAIITQAASIQGQANISAFLQAVLTKTVVLKGTASLEAVLNTVLNQSSVLKGNASLGSTLGVNFTFASSIGAIANIASGLNVSFAQAVDLYGSAVSAASMAMSMSQSSSIKGTGSASVSMPIQVTQLATLKGVGDVGVTASVAIDQTVSISSNTGLSASLGIDVSQSSTLKGQGGLAAPLELVLDVATSLKGDAATGASVTISMTKVSDLKGTASGSASMPLAFAQSSSLKGLGGLATAMSVAVNQVSELKGSAALSSSVLMELALNASFNAGADISSSMAIAINQNSVLKGTGALDSALSIAFVPGVALKGQSSLSANLPLALSILSAIEAKANNDISASMAVAITQDSSLKGIGGVAGVLNTSFGVNAVSKGVGSMSSSTTLTLSQLAHIQGVADIGSALQVALSQGVDLGGIANVSISLPIVHTVTSSIKGEANMSPSVNVVFTLGARGELDGVMIESQDINSYLETILTKLSTICTEDTKEGYVVTEDVLNSYVYESTLLESKTVV